MKYILISIIVVLLVVAVKKEPLPEICKVERNARVYDIVMKDTVIVYSTYTGNTGLIRIRNKYGKQYVLKCGEYK